MCDIQNQIMQKQMCEYCNKFFEKRFVRHKARNINICISCVKMLKNWREEMKIIKPNQKIHTYPNRPYDLHIQENKVDMEALKDFYTIMGYDPEKDIHKQFMEKHNL